MIQSELPTLTADHECENKGTCEGACGGCPSAARSSTIAISDAPQDGLLPAPEHVLSTLERDGSRRWLHPKLAMGRFWQSRRVVAYCLMAVFVAVPHLRLNSKPLLLLDIAAFEFTVLGFTFLPTDTLALALFLLTIFVTIVLVTAMVGRAWCGWACPQTVYTEFLFRPIDRFFEGTASRGGKPKRKQSGWRVIARIAVYVVLSMFLAHTFLAYFVGVDKLSQWVRSSPIHHPAAFLVMSGTTAAMLFDFLYFREQMCTLACPYGRFQSVLLDSSSLLVGFDHERGEPRGNGRRGSTQDFDKGDCLDCKQCVTVCPMGIDIRDGLQMECINCTQCMDACDSVMRRVGRPTGLIRYGSQNSFAGKPSHFVRTRPLIYLAILGVLLSGLTLVVSAKSGFDARIIRGRGATFSVERGMSVANNFSLRLVNRTKTEQRYELTLSNPALDLEIVDPLDLQLPAGESGLAPLIVRFDTALTRPDGNEPVQLTVRDRDGRTKTLRFRVLGPR
ncbi:MAG: cytochrome c oxidase accessory protein CcoG [Planctomycetota bacterium]